MIKSRFIIFISLTALTVRARKSLPIYQVDPHEKVFKERAYFTISDIACSPAGEKAPIQLVVKGTRELKKLSAKTIRITGCAKILHEKTGWVTYLPGCRNYSPASLEVLSSVYGYFPAPFIDDTMLNITPGDMLSLWKPIALPGRWQRAFISKIHPVKISKTSSLITNWLALYHKANLAILNKGQKVIANSPLHWDYLNYTLI